MSFINSYGDPTITTWEVDDNGNKISVPVLNETKQVVGNKFTLEGFPDEQFRVFIDNLDIRSDDEPNIIQFVEINIKEKITETNQFKVDYRKTGNVFVHESLDGKWLNVSKYSSRGLIYLPASRIWTKVDDFGEVIETLDSAVAKIELVGDAIANLDNSINTATDLTILLEDYITDGNQLKLELPLLVSDANMSKGELENSIDSASAINDTLSNPTGTIANANASKLELDSSIANANTINDTLSDPITGTIKDAQDINNTLNISIGLGENSIIDIDNAIVNADTSKSELDGSIFTADNLKIGLDTSIVEGEVLKGELDNIIAGSDFEGIITDIVSLKADQHTHKNKAVIDTITNVLIDKWNKIEEKADKTYVDGKVKTDVPKNAKFTDTVTDLSVTTWGDFVK